GEELGDLRRREPAVVVDARDGLTLTERAALETTNGDAADVVVVRRRGHEELRRRRGVDVGTRYAVDDRVEHRLERRADVTVGGARGAEDRVRVQGGELGLLLGRAEIEEEIERLV